MVKSRAYGGFYALGFSLSKFDIDTSTTTKNQMQCRQSCSWQLLICFDQRQIFQVFWAVYFPWSEVVWFFSSLKASLRHWFGKKKLGIYLYQKNNCLQLLVSSVLLFLCCLTFSFPSFLFYFCIHALIVHPTIFTVTLLASSTGSSSSVRHDLPQLDCMPDFPKGNVNTARSVQYQMPAAWNEPGRIFCYSVKIKTCSGYTTKCWKVKTLNYILSFTYFNFFFL